MNINAEIKPHMKKIGLQNSLIDTIKVVLYAVLIAFLVRVFLLQSFFIPSGSMVSTLLVGDYLFISKYSYGYSKYSLPFKPNLFSGRIFSSSPKRGDVAVFHLQGTDYIKRVVGLPGDTIQMVRGRLHINGQPVRLRRLPDYTTSDLFGMTRSVARFEEQLPNGKKHDVLDIHPNASGDNTQLYKVPAGHYFMMGDNRDNSNDSRFMAPVGFVPLENFIGRAVFRYYSQVGTLKFSNIRNWPSQIRWSRMFTWIR